MQDELVAPWFKVRDDIHHHPVVGPYIIPLMSLHDAGDAEIKMRFRFEALCDDVDNLLVRRFCRHRQAASGVVEADDFALRMQLLFETAFSHLDPEDRALLAKVLHLGEVNA